MCKKQTSVSHSSTEPEVISLDAGLRMDGILALDQWDVVIEVSHSSDNIQASRNRLQQPRNRLRAELQSIHTKPNTKTMVVTGKLMSYLHVVTSAKPSHFEAQLYIFEDNEAVIKMIIKGRSPTMRHVKNSQSCVKLVV